MNRSWRAGAENTRPWFKARLHPRPGGGFLDRIDRAFDWPAFEALLAPTHASVRGARILPLL